MRERSGAEHIRSFIDFVGRRARHAADVYFVGGGSAVLFGWRPKCGHAHDLDDVAHMRAEKLIEPARLLELFNQIEPELYRFPAVDPVSFRKDVEAFVNVNESDR